MSSKTLTTKTMIVIKTILEKQLENLKDPKVIKEIPLLKRPYLKIAKKQIKNCLKELEDVLEYKKLTKELE